MCMLIQYLGFMGFFFKLRSWMFEHDCLDTCCSECLISHTCHRGGISYLSQGRYLIHICIVRKEIKIKEKKKEKQMT